MRCVVTQVTIEHHLWLGYYFKTHKRVMTSGWYLSLLQMLLTLQMAVIRTLAIQL